MEGREARQAQTVANLAPMEPGVVDGLEILLNGGIAFDPAKGAKGISILRALPHGHAAAALGTARAVGLERILHRTPSRERDLALAATVARITAPDSKLATARRLSPETADSSLGAMLGLGPVCGNEMLAMLDWLRRRQPWIERSLANRHLGDGTLILHDVTSSYLEGRHCPLAAFGHSRDGKRGRMQITFGLLCAADGCPLAVEVFHGNASDPSTVASQVARLRTRFGIGRIALVGDRGMITTARIRQDLEPAGLDWISALRNADIRRLLHPSHGEAPLRPGEAVADAVAEISGPDFPGERLMVCLNPRLRQERRRKREELLLATEAELHSIADAAARRRPGQANRDRTGRAIGAKGNRRKVLKHFDITLGMDSMTFRRNDARIAAEAALDGICVVRTSIPADAIGPEGAVEACKALLGVERAFRCTKSDLRVRPIHVRTEEHVRGHVFLCMLAYHVEWHMRRRLAPILFEDDDPGGARCRPGTAVLAGRQGRGVARRQAEGAEEGAGSARRRCDGGGRLTAFNPATVHSFATLFDDLSTLTLNTVKVTGRQDITFEASAKPTNSCSGLAVAGCIPEEGAGSARRRCDGGGRRRAQHADMNPGSIRRRAGKTAAFPMQGLRRQGRCTDAPPSACSLCEPAADPAPRCDSSTGSANACRQGEGGRSARGVARCRSRVGEGMPCRRCFPDHEITSRNAAGRVTIQIVESSIRKGRWNPDMKAIGRSFGQGASGPHWIAVMLSDVA